MTLLKDLKGQHFVNPSRHSEILLVHSTKTMNHLILITPGVGKSF